MHISSVFGSRSRKINSDSLRYLEIESVFGSLDLYCNDAMIEDGAVIKLENVFSTTRIYFDKDVRVISNMTNVFAGLRDDQSSYQAQGPTVVLRGENVFGGVEIIYL